MKEDKIEILQNLLKLLQSTRAFSDLVSIEYEKRGSGWFDEYAVLTYGDGRTKRINISGDSGTGIMIDVLRNTGWLD